MPRGTVRKSCPAFFWKEIRVTVADTSQPLPTPTCLAALPHYTHTRMERQDDRDFAVNPNEELGTQ